MFVKKVAALLTCHNRKDKTLKCLEHLTRAFKKTKYPFVLDIYLTDDGSTDGTSEKVKELFPKVIVLEGNGNLFWVNGMNNSWNHALKENYDGYLLINDDTYVFDTLFEQIDLSDKSCVLSYGKEGVYVGTTLDEKSGRVTYGGSVITNRILYKYYRLIPNGTIQKCDLGNANIMYVPKSVVKKVGVLSDGYLHGIADYDYTLKCVSKKVPVVIMPSTNGYCEYDHGDMYHEYENKSLKERIRYLHHPLGVDFKSRHLYMKRFFPVRAPFFYLGGWLKTIFPKT